MMWFVLLVGVLNIVLGYAAAICLGFGPTLSRPRHTAGK